LLVNNCFFFQFLVALAALKRKKRYEKQLQQIDGTLSTIEFQTEALENANTNTEVLKVMRTAGQALKGAHQNLYVIKSCLPSKVTKAVSLAYLFIGYTFFT